MQELKRGGGYPAGRKALPDLGMLRGLIRKLAERHGTPCIETRPYSTLCPARGQKMHELQNCRVSCPKCGLEAHRDGVPIMWAVRRFGELPQRARSQRRGPSPRPAGVSPGPRRAEGS